MNPGNLTKTHEIANYKRGTMREAENKSNLDLLGEGLWCL